MCEWHNICRSPDHICKINYRTHENVKIKNFYTFNKENVKNCKSNTYGISHSYLELAYGLESLVYISDKSKTWLIKSMPINDIKIH